MIKSNGGKRWSAIGLSVLDDRSGQAGIFKLQDIGLSYALNIFPAKRQTLSIGFNSWYRTRTVSLEGLVTGSQFIDNRGFDASISNGENFSRLNANFMSFGAGIFWQKEDRTGQRIAHWGLAVHDLNRPDESFFDDGVGGNLPSTLVAEAGIEVYNKQGLSILPELLYTLSASSNLLNVGAVWRYDLASNPSQFGGLQGLVDFHTKYVMDRYVILGVQFHQPKFSAGFSYDLPVHGTNVGNQGAFEFALEFKQLVESRFKSPKPRKFRNTFAKNRRRRVPKRRPSKSKKNKRVLADKKKSGQNKGKQEKTESLASKQVEQTTLTEETKTESIVEEGHSLIANTSEESQSEKPADSLSTSTKVGRITQNPLIIENTTVNFKFDFNRYDLDDEDKQYLDGLCDILNQDTFLRIKIIGHTDNVGSDSYNMKLSKRRVEVIKSYIISKGVQPGRIKAIGMGEAQPLNENNSEDDRAANRRVEFTIYR